MCNTFDGLNMLKAEVDKAVNMVKQGQAACPDNEKRNNKICIQLCY